MEDAYRDLKSAQASVLARQQLSLNDGSNKDAGPIAQVYTSKMERQAEVDYFRRQPATTCAIGATTNRIAAVAYRPPVVKETSHWCTFQ